MKVMTNYSVTLEKMQKRDEAIEILNKLKETYSNEIRVYNNLGIVHKRNGQLQEAEKNFIKAL